MVKTKDIFSEHKLWIILIALFIVLISGAVYKLYEIYFSYYITAKFSESGPLYVNMPVYYRGYNIGRTTKVKPDKDYKHTLVKIMLYPREPKLPVDIVAKVKNHNVRKEYIDLLSQDDSSTTFIKRGSTVDGEPAFDLEAFLSDIADSGIIVPLLQNFSDTLTSINKASSEAGKLFSDSRFLLKDNRQNLKQATNDFAKTSRSLTKLTSRVNNSFTEEKLNNTTTSVNKSSTNILTASENIKRITGSIDCATRNLETTMARIDSTVADTKIITTNVKTITGGICETLTKKFAGMRILFGKPLNNGKCGNHCCR